MNYTREEILAAPHKPNVAPYRVGLCEDWLELDSLHARDRETIAALQKWQKAATIEIDGWKAHSLHQIRRHDKVAVNLEELRESVAAVLKAWDGNRDDDSGEVPELDESVESLRIAAGLDLDGGTK